MQKNERKQKALEILKDMGVTNLEYLGQGCDGIVFHDNDNVYKVIISYSNKAEVQRRLSYFRNIEHCNTIYKIDDCIDVDGVVVVKYKYELSVPCHKYSEDEAIEFLVDCFRQRIIVKDCKPHNFIRVNDHIKLVDMEACEYSDNLFLNMCVRMYLYSSYLDILSIDDCKKLTHSAINNFDLPEIEGAREFVNKVFARIIFEESKPKMHEIGFPQSTYIEEYNSENLPNLETLFYSKLKESKYLYDIRISDIKLNEDLYFEPEKIWVAFNELKPLTDKVSLLIKTCAQDDETIEANIRHIVRQLSTPNPFFEIVVSIDTRKGDFLRQYNSNGGLENLINVVDRLKREEIIDRYVIFDESKTEEINSRWFGLTSSFSHTASKIPVTPQLYAFEQCNGDYILQMDSDVIIGRKDSSHSYLTDMINQLKKNEKVISVGFNIYNKESKSYFGFEDGGFVPEVRLGLIDKQRFFALRPFPNMMDDEGRLKLSWHRSVEQFQKQSGYCSIRGGNHKSFYIHPQNYRKKYPYAWITILDRVEQLQLPDVQYGGFDCEGSFCDWCKPKRNEKMVIVSCFRNVSIPRFLRFWYSIMNQSYQDFGVILYDDCSDNGLPVFIRSLIQPYQDRITFVSAKFRDERMANVYRAIHYFCSNPDSIIVMVDGDDALIGRGVLADVLEKYEFWDKDVVVGRVHQTYRLQPHYRYPANFYSPRKTNGGNVYQHLKTFKKYLFDSIPLTYFKHSIVDKVRLNNNPWIESCDDYAFMIPIVEMCKKPLQTDYINYFYERDYQNRNAGHELKELCIAEIINKPSLSPENVFKGRKTFRPDFQRIEIDLTYDCNLKCIGCNRSCSQAPTKSHLLLQDIENFVQESIRAGREWQLINVLGGEPTLHDDFMNILALLQNYVEAYSPKTIIKVVSNGVSERSRWLCEVAKDNFKNVMIDYSSFKDSNKVEYFTPFNDAPADDDCFKNADFTKACWVASYCGIGLNAGGYYACAVCGGIDRVIDGHNGAKTIADLTEGKINEHYDKFCRLCGNFKHYDKNAGDFIPRSEKEPFRNVVSKTWEELYKQYMLIQHTGYNRGE